MAPRPHVTDHAVLRYLEHVMGLDIEAVRKRVALEVRGAVQNGATRVRLDGRTYVLDENRVVTVIKGTRSGGQRCRRRETPAGGAGR